MSDPLDLTMNDARRLAMKLIEHLGRGEDGVYTVDGPTLVQFAFEVMVLERERCANIAEQIPGIMWDDWGMHATGADIKVNILSGEEPWPHPVKDRPTRVRRVRKPGGAKKRDSHNPIVHNPLAPKGKSA